MTVSRTTTAIVGVILSLLVSVLAWYYFETVLLFLFVPFVPLVLRGRADGGSDPGRSTCPACGFETRDAGYEYCPRDGTPLE